MKAVVFGVNDDDDSDEQKNGNGDKKTMPITPSPCNKHQEGVSRIHRILNKSNNSQPTSQMKGNLDSSNDGNNHDTENGDKITDAATTNTLSQQKRLFLGVGGKDQCAGSNFREPGMEECKEEIQPLHNDDAFMKHNRPNGVEEVNPIDPSMKFQISDNNVETPQQEKQMNQKKKRQSLTSLVLEDMLLDPKSPRIMKTAAAKEIREEKRLSMPVMNCYDMIKTNEKKYPDDQHIMRLKSPDSVSSQRRKSLPFSLP